jgi:hypothetical protein
MAAPTAINIKRKRGDTRRMVFAIKDSDGTAVDLTSWNTFVMTIAPSPNPEDNTSSVGAFTGTVVDAAAGRVSFTPTVDVPPAGFYFYDAQALDANGEKVTFAEGSYEVTQDITKS